MSRPMRGSALRKLNVPTKQLEVCANDVPSMQVKVEQGILFVSDTIFIEYAGGVSPVISAPTSNAKYVFVTITTNGQINTISGASSINPLVPVLLPNNFPLALIYLQSSDTKITNDMIDDCRPIYKIGSRVVTHNTVLERSEDNCHPISSITDLTDQLNDRPLIVDVNDWLTSKSDIDGTPSPVFTLNKDASGVPSEDAFLMIGRGSQLSVGFKYNESDNRFEFTNDGTSWTAISSGGLEDHQHTGTNEGGYLGTDAVNDVNQISDNLITLVKLHTSLSNYLLLNNVNSIITSSYTFNPTVQNPPFILGTNARNQLVSYLNADKLDGFDAEYFSVASHNHDTIYAPIVHNHDTIYSLIDHNHSGVYSLIDHNHDAEYYTKSQTDSLLTDKANLVHNHDTIYAAIVHNHDTLYYTQSQIDTFLSGKSDTAHDHDTSYYTKSQIDTSLSSKSDSTHNHDTVYAPIIHNHDTDYSNIGHNHDTVYAPIAHDHNTDYYTQSQVDTSLSNKMDNWVSPPASSNSSGVVGQKSYDSDYFYVCVATDTWKRTPLSTW